MKRVFHPQDPPGRFGVGVRCFRLGAVDEPELAFSSEEQQMCTGDAFRLCSSEIPNIPAITACMISTARN